MLESLKASKPADAVAQLTQLPLLMQALAAAATLGVADRLTDGPRTSADLAQDVGAHAPTLYRLLRALAGVGLFEEVAPQTFALTPMGACLRSDAPDSQRAYVSFFAGPAMWQSSQLLPTAQSGHPAWDQALGSPVFEYLRAHPDVAVQFNAAMSDAMRQRQRAVASYAFTAGQTVVDVGGNQGRLLASMLQAQPTLRGVLFDLPQVVAGAQPVLEAAGVAERCTVVGGDFFAAVPAGGDVYLLSAVLHDWEDAPAIRILQSCRRAMGAHGRLVVLERVLPGPNELSLAVLSDLVMLMVGGRERTAAEYATLLAAADFTLQRIVPSDSPFCLIEASP